MINPITCDELITITSGYLTGNKPNVPVDKIIIDSRKIVPEENALFIALQGLKLDGHEFVTEAYRKGIRYFIMEKHKTSEVLFSSCPEACFILVPDSLEALQHIAAFVRKQFPAPVVGITGSNGKTIIKEWLGHILGNLYSVAKSPKSFNSQVGVPLSILGIQAYHQIAILEAGISQAGEMAKLREMILPEIGIFTNLGTAHQLGFENENEKLKEKLKLFSQSRYILYRKDQQKAAKLIESTYPAERLVSWSEHPGADYTLSLKKGRNSTKILLIKPDLSLFTFYTGFSDPASLENIRHVIAACLTLDIPLPKIKEGIQTLRSIEMRLTIKQGIKNCTLIDDTYNNDLAGLELALEFLASQRPKKRKVLILSEMLQTKANQELYLAVGKLLRHYQIDQLYAVGKEMENYRQFLPKSTVYFEETPDLIRSIQPDEFENDLILIKGARKFGFEKIVGILQEKIHGTTLEINLNALSHNFHFYKKRLKKDTKIMVMVKAFAYGGGAVEIANHVQQLRADYLSVAYTDEGVELRKQGITLPIMVLNPVKESFLLLAKYDLEPVVFSLSFFHWIAEFCQNENISLKIHLDLDTGMHRLGFMETEIEELIQMIRLHRAGIKIASIYTHLAGADEKAHEDFSLQQIHSFRTMANKIKAALNYSPLLHMLNSAGIIRFPEYQMDMVRLGIGLYGIEVNHLHDKDLEPISTLKTTISQIRYLEKGQTIGYGRKGSMQEKGKIATIAIGYADGYSRRFSNGAGYVMIRDQKAPIIGNVCMDMSMVDISHIQEVQEGEEVVVYGEGISLKELADKIDTIPYELLTSISSRVKRIYYLD